MIKNVSSTFKANCKKDSVKYREYIVIDNKEVDIKGDLSNTAYKDTTFFGKFNLIMLKFETENDIDYKKKEFIYYKEVDGEALKIGTFIVTDVSDSDTFESVNITAYDYGLKFANPYTTNLDYTSGNTTLLQQMQEICTNCDIELENTTLPNGSFIVDSNQFVNNEKYGDVIAQASGINGMFATINSNDKLEFIFQNETNEIIEDYVELDDKRDTHPITSVLVATSEDLETAGAVMKDENLIKQYGEHWLKIYSYGYAYSTEKCQQLVNAIFNQVKGFGYSSFKSKYSFLPYLTLGDKIQFKNKEGQLVNSLILRYETNYDEITFEAPSMINASVDYELPETPENMSKKALIKVNQANAEIVLKVNNNGKIVQAQLKTDASDGSEFNISADNIKLEGYTTINNGFSIDKNGNATMNNATINGGSIDLVDTGSESEPKMRIYNADQVVYVKKKLEVGYDLASTELTLDFPEKFDGTPTAPSVPFEILIEFENGAIRYNYGYQYSEFINIYFHDNNTNEDIELYSGNGLTPATINVKKFTLPSNIGKIKSINSTLIDTTNNIPLSNYIYYLVRTINDSTEYSSSGIYVKNQNNYCYHNIDGILIKDERGIREFSNNGITWMTPYGSDYKDFIVSKDGVTFGDDRLVQGGNILRLNMESNPFLGIVTTEPIGGTTTYGVDVWISDKRLKNSIENTKINALNIVKQIKHYQFKYNNGNETIKIGYVADNLEEIDKQMIFESGEDKIKQPKESYLIPILSKAIQELNDKVEKLEKKILELEKEDD